MFFQTVLSLLAFVNPFEIDFAEKKELEVSDYVQVQKLLREKNIHSVLSEAYSNPSPNGMVPYGDMFSRCSRGLSQVLIDTDKGLYPKKELYKIGSGGDNCVVCCTPLAIVGPDGSSCSLRARLAESIRDALEKTGFNGHFLLFVGGFPNPTGKEIRYAGVPYCFKIFAMLEAYQLGMNRVIWIDSACLPLNNPEPIFRAIEAQGAAFLSFEIGSYFPTYIFPKTHQLLNDLTQSPLANSRYIYSIVFGLKMNSPKVQKLIAEYYQMVALGWPFLSCFPEEFVLSSLCGKEEFRSLYGTFDCSKLFVFPGEGTVESDEFISLTRNSGYFFLNRKH